MGPPVAEVVLPKKYPTTIGSKVQAGGADKSNAKMAPKVMSVAKPAKPESKRSPEAAMMPSSSKLERNASQHGKPQEKVLFARDESKLLQPNLHMSKTGSKEIWRVAGGLLRGG